MLFWQNDQSLLHATLVTQGFEQTPNKSQHRKLTLISSMPNRKGHWGTTDDFATSFLHFSLFSTALWDLVNPRPVHSLMEVNSGEENSSATTVGNQTCDNHESVALPTELSWPPQETVTGSQEHGETLQPGTKSWKGKDWIESTGNGTIGWNWWQEHRQTVLASVLTCVKM